VVFGLVALTAAVSASGIAYWLNREAVLTRTQDAVLGDFQQAMQTRASALPAAPHAGGTAARRRADGEQQPALQRAAVAEDENGKTVRGNSDLDTFTLEDVPKSLQKAVNKEQEISSNNKYTYHLYWQRIVQHDKPYLVGGAKVIGGGPTGYMLKSLEPEAKDLNSLAWSLGIATGLALIGSALLAQAAATTVLKPVHRLGTAARRLGEGKLDTRLRVSGTDELADLSRTFNRTAESLEKRVADMSAREQASRRFVADMSHELRTPLTAITAVTEVLEEELDAETGSVDPMIEPAVRLVVSETRRLNNLVENLMEVTRFDAGTARLVLDNVDIVDQITACIDARAWLDAVDLDAERGLHGARRPAPPGRDHGEPHRQRPQARRLPGAGVVRTRGTTWSSRSRTTVPASRRTSCRTSSTASTRRAPPGRVPRAAASACPSPWRTPTSTAARSPPPTRPRAARCSPCGCRATPRSSRRTRTTPGPEAAGRRPHRGGRVMSERHTWGVRHDACGRAYAGDACAYGGRTPDACGSSLLAVPLLAVLLAGCGIRATEVPTDFGPAPSRVPCTLTEPDIGTQASRGILVQVFLLCPRRWCRSTGPCRAGRHGGRHGAYGPRRRCWTSSPSPRRTPRRRRTTRPTCAAA
jgi:methyl-accepting chemotaxis protein